jgi:hypothetical protein
MSSSHSSATPTESNASGIYLNRKSVVREIRTLRSVRAEGAGANALRSRLLCP